MRDLPTGHGQQEGLKPITTKECGGRISLPWDKHCLQQRLGCCAKMRAMEGANDIFTRLPQSAIFSVYFGMKVGQQKQ
ncbi:hypothetical protein RvY_18500 [Ramazzottius varieornatus]|uniref:Uncharacterized protein n=1 Tax=Ramazzottius varieornatus TaxID=947166 RepID=A0A1D1W601_RAMVA|nr:hypothetical protein RvY_18500 [Ramazzottius varieornatus]